MGRTSACLHPGGELRIVETGMADVEVEAALAAFPPSGSRTQDAFHQPAAHAHARSSKHIEEVGGRPYCRGCADSGDGERRPAPCRRSAQDRRGTPDLRRSGGGPPIGARSAGLRQAAVARRWPGGLVQRMVLRTVATGSTEDARMFTKRCRSDSCELATYMTSPSRIPNFCAAK